MFQSKNVFAFNEGDDSNLTLIQRLAALSVNQSGTHLHDIDPETGAMKHKRIFPKDGKALKDSKTAMNKSVLENTGNQC